MSPRAILVRGGVVVAVALVVLGAASATPWVVTLNLPSWGRVSRPLPSMPEVTIAPQQQTADDSSLGRTLATVGTVLFAVVVAALVGFVVYRLAQRLRAAWRPDDAEVEPDLLEGDVPGESVAVDLASLATAVARARAHLEGHAEPGDAVVAAWVALEDEAALQGTARHPAQTPTEFTSVLLEHTSAPPDAVATLRGLYQRARFTDRPVTPDDVHAARAAIDRIAGAIDTSPWARP